VAVLDGCRLFRLRGSWERAMAAYRITNLDLRYTQP
jgi:hypothetical protein